MTILIRNFPAHINKDPPPTYEINDINPQTMTRVSSYYCIFFTTHKDASVSVYKSHKRNIIKPSSRKMLRKLLCEKQRNLILAKIYKSKNVNVGIKTQHIFQSLKEDKSSDMDVMNMYEHLSVSI